MKRIINALSSVPPKENNEDIEASIAHLKNTTIEKRDGWLFQIISWLALTIENKDKHFFSQQPHDAPAQHGIDGLAIVLDDNSQISKIIITEDKCTINPRNKIQQQIWPEFIAFEKGSNTNKLVSRISAMLENLDDGNILQAIQNDIYSKELWTYRIGVNRDDRHITDEQRIKLFKGYSDSVKGDAPHRRYASTLHKTDIRAWMNNFSQLVINYLESQKK